MKSVFVSQMKKALVIASCGLALMGCKEEFQGTMGVNVPLSLKDKKGNEVLVNAGSFATKLSLDSKNLKIEIPDSSGKVRKIEMKHGLQDKDINEISIPASLSGQIYDLVGQRSVNISSQTISSGSRSCSECVDHREACGYEGGGQSCSNVTECDPNGSGQCKTRQVCHTEQPVYRCHTVCDRYFYGSEDVTRYQTTETTSVVVMLKNAASELVAQFNASKAKVSNSTSVGSCR